MRNHAVRAAILAFPLALGACCGCRFAKIDLPPPRASEPYRTAGLTWQPLDPAAGEMSLSRLTRGSGGHMFIEAHHAGRPLLIRGGTDGKWESATLPFPLTDFVEGPHQGELLYHSANAKAFLRDKAGYSLPYPAPFANPFGQINGIALNSSGAVVAGVVDYGDCCERPNPRTAISQLRISTRDRPRWRSLAEVGDCGRAQLRFQSGMGAYGPCSVRGGQVVMVSRDDGYRWSTSAVHKIEGSTTLLTPTAGGPVLWFHSKYSGSTLRTYLRILDLNGTVVREVDTGAGVWKASYNGAATVIGAFTQKMFRASVADGQFQLVHELPAGDSWLDVAFLDQSTAFAIARTGLAAGVLKWRLFSTTDGGTTWKDVTPGSSGRSGR